MMYPLSLTWLFSTETGPSLDMCSAKSNEIPPNLSQVLKKSSEKKESIKKHSPLCWVYYKENP